MTQEFKPINLTKIHELFEKHKLNYQNFDILFDFNLLKPTLEQVKTFDSVKIKYKKIKYPYTKRYYYTTSSNKTIDFHTMRYGRPITFIKKWIIDILTTNCNSCYNRQSRKALSDSVSAIIKDVMPLIPVENFKYLDDSYKKLYEEFGQTEEQIKIDFQNQIVNNLVNKISVELKTLPIDSAKIIVKKVIDKLMIDAYYT
jgi:hypothetical protein